MVIISQAWLSDDDWNKHAVNGNEYKAGAKRKLKPLKNANEWSWHEKKKGRKGIKREREGGK